MEKVCMKKRYSTPETEFLEVRISDVCQATSPTDNPLDKWEEREPITGEI